MVSFRRGALLAGVIGLGVASIDSQPAQSQGSGSGAVAPVDPALIEIEDEESAGSAAGDADPMVAPAAPAARKAWLGERLTSALRNRPTLGRAKVGVVVRDLTTGDVLFSLAGDQGMNLASNAKLLTAIAGLGTLGSGFRWRTAVFAQPPDPAGLVRGDLHLRGRGDPLLSVAHLEALADELAARGIRRIEGKLVLDTSYFDGDVEPPHFDEQPEERAAFRAPVASLGVARSAATLKVVADLGGAATVTLEPDAGEYLRITKREVISVSEGRGRRRLDVKPKRNHIELEISGQIRAGESGWNFRRRVDNPARFAGEVFKQALAARGITFRLRGIGFGPVPTTARMFAVHDSAPLADVVRYMNKASDNYIAETLLKTIGAESRSTPGPATWADGIAAVRAYLTTLGLTPGTYRYANGSGLFGSTDVSATQLVALLEAAHTDYRLGPDLLASLPIGGIDGTLARRWRGRPARGRVRAKTGTLEKVITLSGFVANDSRTPLAFAILVNDVPPGQKPVARAMADEMVSAMAAYLGAR